MYLDALEFLDEERDAWAPFEELAELDDEQLSTPVAEAHGWSGRQLMSHLLAWQENAMVVAQELAVDETSPTKARSDADWDEQGGEAINAALEASWAGLSMAEIRRRFATIPGELRGYLTVVPETRWVKHATYQRFFSEETTEHYADHLADLRAILAATRR